MRWNVDAAPNGCVLGYELDGIDERALLRPGGLAAVYALDGAGVFHPARAPLVVLHGLDGAPAQLQAVVDRYRGSLRLQPYIVAYADKARRTSLNADDLAAEWRALAARFPAATALTIIAHSMGGIVARRAVNDLISGGGVERFLHIRVICVDTPWHGYPGPEDGWLMDAARPFLAAGLQDMRARSPMFETLYATALPESVALTLVFAEQGSDVLDYTEPPLDQLAARLDAHFANDAPVAGEPRLANFWKALLSSDQYDHFADELRDLSDANQLHATEVREALLRHYPRFPGDHVGVLREQPGHPSFLDWLTAELPP
jgi:hypothetical protein